MAIRVDVVHGKSIGCTGIVVPDPRSRDKHFTRFYTGETASSMLDRTCEASTGVVRLDVTVGRGTSSRSVDDMQSGILTMLRSICAPRWKWMSLWTALIASAALSVNADERPLWRPVAQKKVSGTLRSVPDTGAPDDSGVRVTVKPDVLMRGPTPGESQFDIALPDGVTFRGVVERTRVERPDRFISTGRLLGQPFSDFLFIVDRGRVGGVITPHPAVRYMILPTDESGVHRVTGTVVADLPPGGSRVPDPQIIDGPRRRSATRQRSTAPATQPAGAINPSGAIPVIDVLIVYTPRVKTVLGGTAAAEFAADLAIQLANEAYANSQCVEFVRLVKTAEVEYFETGVAGSDLDALTRPADGEMDEVITLRTDFRADLVHLFVAFADFSDLGWLNTWHTFNQTWSFSVSTAPSLQAETFTRAIGSNQGIDHDWQAPPPLPQLPLTPFPYSFGYAFTGNSGNTWGTIMSNTNSTRIRQHSNPTLTFDGVATGRPLNMPMPSHAALSLNNTATTIAAISDGTIVPPPVISSPTTATGIAGLHFEYQITATNGPTSFGAAGLPAGLTLNTSTGLISGSVGVPGVYLVDITATNAGGTGIKVLTLTIDELNDCPLQRAARRLKPLGLVPPGFAALPESHWLDTARRFRDDVLRATPEGRAVVEAYYRHGAAAFAAVCAQPELFHDLAACWLELSPKLKAVEPNGRLVLTVEEAARIDRLLDDLAVELHDKQREAVVIARAWMNAHVVVR